MSLCVAVGSCAIPTTASSPASAYSGNIIRVESTPTGANVIVEKTSGETLGSGETPFRVHVHCYDTAVIRVSAPGFVTQTVSDPPNHHIPMSLGPVQLTGGCHSQEAVNVVLVKSPAQTGSAPP